MNASARSMKVTPIFLAFIIVVLAVPLSRHALERHPIDAPLAVECMDKNGIDFEMIDPYTQRIAKVCHEPNQPYVWYVLIFCAAGSIITAYRRQRARCRRDVESYLRDGGWQFKKKGK